MIRNPPLKLKAATHKVIWIAAIMLGEKSYLLSSCTILPMQMVAILCVFLLLREGVYVTEVRKRQ